MPRRRFTLPVFALALLLSAATANAAYRDLSPSAEVAKQIRSPATLNPVWTRNITASDASSAIAAWSDATGSLRVYVADTDNGRVLAFDGASGEPVPLDTGSGLSTPTALFAIDDLLFVVERDSRRVQTFALPALQPLGTVGEGGLIQPTSLFARQADVDSYLLYVGDDYDNDGNVPPDRDLNRRVKSYLVTLHRDANAAPESVSAERVGQIGETSGDGVVRRMGALGGDAFYDHLLIGERDRGHDSGYRVYGFAGKYRNASLGQELFRRGPADIALRGCDSGGGHWLASDSGGDEDANSPLLVMDRASLRPIGAFTLGSGTVDSLWFQNGKSPAFPSGLLFARQGNRLVAIDWRDIARELRLDPACR